MTRTLLSIGYDKNGEEDFAASGEIMNLTYWEMQRFRATIAVAIGIAEDMWRREQMRQNPAQQNAPTEPT